MGRTWERTYRHRIHLRRHIRQNLRIRLPQPSAEVHYSEKIENKKMSHKT